MGAGRGAAQLAGGSIGATELAGIAIGDTEIWSAAKPIAFDVAGPGDSRTDPGPLSWVHPESALPRAVLVAVTVFGINGGITVAGATCDGQPMTTLASRAHNNQQTTSGASYLLGILARPGAAQPIELEITAQLGFAQGYASSVSYAHVGAFGSSFASHGNGGVPSLSVTSAPGRMIVQHFGRGNGTMSNYSQVQRYLGIGISTCSMIIGEAPGAETPVSFTVNSASGAWAGLAVDLLPE